MSILNYEKHTDIADPHEMLNKFGIFAGTYGWTVDHNIIDVGNWNTGTGSFDPGEQTYVMLTSTGATNGQHAAQIMTYQLWSEHRTEGTSGDQGTWLVHGRDNTATKDISDPSVRDDHPIYQARWTLSNSNYYRFYFKGSPPNVWFFGNAHFLACCVDNNGILTSVFCIGCPETFDKTLTYTDCNFIGMPQRNSNRNEWDSDSSELRYYYLPFVLATDRIAFRINGESYAIPNVWRSTMDVIPDWSTHRTCDTNSSYSIWSRISWLFSNENGDYYAGYKMPYSNSRFLYKPMFWIYNYGSGGMMPYGEGPFYWCYSNGLSSGDVITQGTKEFMVFQGFNARDMGIAFRIA